MRHGARPAKAISVGLELLPLVQEHRDRPASYRRYSESTRQQHASQHGSRAVRQARAPDRATPLDRARKHRTNEQVGEPPHATRAPRTCPGCAAPAAPFQTPPRSSRESESPPAASAHQERPGRCAPPRRERDRSRPVDHHQPGRRPRPSTHHPARKQRRAEADSAPCHGAPATPVAHHRRAGRPTTVASATSNG